MLGSIGVIAGAIAIRFTGMTWIDPVVAVGIGLWVLPRTWIWLRDTAHVLLEGLPRGFSVEEVRRSIGAVPGVPRVHDLDGWSVPTGNVSCSCPVSGDESEQARESQHLVGPVQRNSETVRG